MKFSIKDLARQAIIAGIYASLTISIYPFSYGAIQFRLSEVLMILILFDKKCIAGLTAGCFIANLFNVGAMPMDLLFGTLGTFLGCLMMIPFKNKALIALIFPVLTNTFLVSLSLMISFPEDSYLYYCLTVGIGEFVMVYLLGNILYRIIGKNQGVISLFQ